MNGARMAARLLREAEVLLRTGVSSPSGSPGAEVVAGWLRLRPEGSVELAEPALERDLVAVSA